MSDGDLDHKTVFKQLIERDGVQQHEATLDQLKARVEYLKTWYRTLKDG